MFHFDRINPDHISWTANFLGEATGIKADGIKSYILMTQPTQIVGDANAIIIGNNNIYKSDYISTIPVTFDLIDDVDQLDPDVLVPGSDTFLEYALPFCQEVYRKVPKFSDARTFCCYLPKVQTKRPIFGVFHPKDANGIANSEDPDQTAPLGAV